MASLRLNPDHVIELWTQKGLYTIEMLFGDITKLSQEERVDIIMVSAFSGKISIFVYIVLQFVLTVLMDLHKICI